MSVLAKTWRVIEINFLMNKLGGEKDDYTKSPFNLTDTLCLNILISLLVNVIEFYRRTSNNQNNINLLQDVSKNSFHDDMSKRNTNNHKSFFKLLKILL